MENVWIAPSAVITGDVILEQGVNIWHGAVLRGDSGRIYIGEGTNIQDNCVVHEETKIGNYCTIGHGAIVHGCVVGNECVVGMGAVVLTGAVLEDNCLVGAGAIVTGKTHAPAGSLLLGNPAKIVKELTQEQRQELKQDAENYITLAKNTLEK